MRLNCGLKKMRDWTGEAMEKAGTAIANFTGGDLGRSFQAKRVVAGIREAKSTSNLMALRWDAFFRPHFDIIDKLMETAEGKKQVYRLADELESHQTPSDPRFAAFAHAWHLSGAKLKQDALSARIGGAQHWNEDLVGRKALPKDVNGKAAWEAGYKTPDMGADRQAALFSFNRYGRRLAGGHEDFVNAAEGHDLAPADKNPFISAVKKRMDVQNYVNGAKEVQRLQEAGIVKKHDFGDKQGADDVKLSDKFFAPAPRRWSAQAKGGLLEKLNDHMVPLHERLTAFKQGIKDGLIQELPPTNANEAFEHYSDGIHDVPGEHLEGQVYEKQSAQGGTGEYGKTRDINTKATLATGEHATGEYTPTYKGLPEGHGIVDDALAQVDRPWYTAPKDVADLLNQHLETPAIDQENPFFRGWNALNDKVLQVKFGLGGFFHYGNLMLGASGGRLGHAVNEGAAAVGNLARLRPSEAAARAGESMTALRQSLPITGTAELLKAGKAMKAALAEPGSALEPEVQAARKSGGIIESPDSFKGEQSGILSKNPVKLVDNVTKAANRLLFEHFGDNLRRGVMSMTLHDEVVRAQREGLDTSSPQFQDRIKKATQATFDTFDTIRRDRNFQSNAVRQALKVGFSFPQWTLSKARLVAQSIRDIPELAREHNMTPAQKAVVGMTLATALAGGAAHWTSTGKAPETAEDFFHPEIFGRRSTIPSPMQPVFSLIYQHGDLLKYAENRLTPAAQVLNDFRNDKDWHGKPTRDTAGEAAGTIYDRTAPSWAHPDKDETFEQWIGNIFGVTKAPKASKK